MESNRGVFLVVLLFFIFFTPAGNAPHISSPNELFRLKEYLSTQWNETEALSNSTWHRFPKNITGISPYPTQKASGGRNFLPPEILDIANQIWHSEITVSTNSAIRRDESLLEFTKRDSVNAEGQILHDVGDFGDPLVFYNNISGVYEGKWHQEKHAQGLIPRNMTIADVFKPPTSALIYGRNVSLTSSSLDQSEYDTIGASRGNMTEKNGKTLLSIHEQPVKNNQQANVTLVTMTVSVYDESEASRFSVELQGFHFKHTGNLVLTTSSLKYSGLQYLPHLILEEDNFEEAKQLMTRYLNLTLTSYENDMDFAIFQDADIASVNCEYIIYGHIRSSQLTKQELQNIEQEFENPVGRPLAHIPELKLSAILYSPDCAVALSTEKVIGEKYETYWYRIRTVILAGVLLLLAQMVLLAKQMKDTSTPSLILKVSFVTITMMAIVDGSIWMASFASFFVEVLALPFMAVAFLSFALTSMFEMRYMVKIYQSQLLETVADARVREATQTNTVNGQTALYAMPDGSIVGSQNPGSRNSNTPQGTESDTLPLPVTSPNTAPATAPAEPEQSERAIAGQIYSRFYFALLIFIIASLLATTWPVWYRIIYEYIIVFGFYSLWVPQIYRNISRGFRKSFLWSFILGTSIIRLIPLVYVCLYKNNVVNHHYDPTLIFSVLLWVGVQLLILAAQSMFGARFFLPKGYLPVLYDYHPILYHGDAEADLGIDVASAGQQLPKPQNSHTTTLGSTDYHEDSESRPNQPLLESHSEQETLRPCVDCAICMMPVELIITPRDGPATSQITTSPALILARRRYMVTPCHHVFHTECMERWMRSRLQCPICRNPLPPL